MWQALARVGRQMARLEAAHGQLDAMLRGSRARPGSRGGPKPGGLAELPDAGDSQETGHNDLHTQVWKAAWLARRRLLLKMLDQQSTIQHAC